MSQEMQTYRPPEKSMFKARISDALSDSSDKDSLSRTIYSQWSDFHAVTRNNLRKFETSELGCLQGNRI